MNKEKEKPETAVVATAPDTIPMATVRAQLHGDWKGVSDADKVRHAVAICKALDIPTPLNPFKFITMNGKDVLYATKEAAELLAERNKISVNILNKYLDREQNLYVVEVRAAMPNGRTFDNLAAMSVAGKVGDIRANIMMKTVSKAIRRVVFSAVGLSVLDDDDIESMKNGAMYASPPPIQPPPIVMQTLIGGHGVGKSDIEEVEKQQEMINEVIDLRAQLINTLLSCGKFKKPAEAKAWVKEQTDGKPLELLDANDCMELLSKLEEREPGEDDVEPELPLDGKNGE